MQTVSSLAFILKTLNIQTLRNVNIWTNSAFSQSLDYSSVCNFAAQWISAITGQSHTFTATSQSTAGKNEEVPMQ